MRSSSAILRIFLFSGFVIFLVGIGFWLGRYTDVTLNLSGAGFLSPLSQQKTTKELPLAQYTIERLAQRQYQKSEITITSLIEDFPEYSAYQFSFITLDKKMSGQINIPKNLTASPHPTIVLIRGYVPLEIYQTGVGTKSAAAVFARHGYITLAPDFFGYGVSDPEAEDSLAARFQKPIEVIELLNSIQANQIRWNLSAQNSPQLQLHFDPERVGIWAHSNGGQIALTTLEILSTSIPATLWAPVTPPFPYSILFFSDEEPDEGKASRQWIAEFDRHYNAMDFSLTDHVHRLVGPLQIQHGITDESALKVWSDEFVARIKKENQARLEPAKPISIKYFTYPNTDHNMQPSWDTAIQRDLEFFGQNLK